MTSRSDSHLEEFYDEHQWNFCSGGTDAALWDCFTSHTEEGLVLRNLRKPLGRLRQGKSLQALHSSKEVLGDVCAPGSIPCGFFHTAPQVHQDGYKVSLLPAPRYKEVEGPSVWVLYLLHAEVAESSVFFQCRVYCPTPHCKYGSWTGQWLNIHFGYSMKRTMPTFTLGFVVSGPLRK